MNLSGIVGGAIGMVNPPIPATLYRSTGYTKSADYKQVPSYDAGTTVLAQVQALTFKDLTQLQGVNMNGEKRGIYVLGNSEGVNRQALRGGDKFVFGSGAPAPLTSTTWIVAQALEEWGSAAPDAWTKVAVTLQNNG
jgi:hypothetical protein